METLQLHDLQEMMKNGERKDIFPGRTLSIKITLHKTRKIYFLENYIVMFIRIRTLYLIS